MRRRSQYQSALSAAVTTSQRPEARRGRWATCSRSRSPENLAKFEEDVKSANVFIGSLIFVRSSADEVIKVVEPERERLDAVLVFPSCPR